MKLAFFTPLNPQKSGIADYSEELLPYLAKDAEIDLYVEQDVTPTNPTITENFAWYPFTQFECNQQQHPYDLCLYQMGNNMDCHRYMDAFIQKYPGVVTLHDYVLHHFYAAMFAEENRYDEYAAAMQKYYGDLGGRIAAKFKQEIRSDYVYYQLPFYQCVVNPSLGTIVHSAYVKNKLLQYDPSYQVELIPMGIIPPELEHFNRTVLREKFQLPQDRFIVSSLGFIIAGKRLRELLQAFAAFVRDVPDALCLLVGQESPDFPIRELVQKLNLKNNVIITGYVPYQSYLEYIALSDVCVNLRYPTVRASSANILKIMAFAKPVLVSDVCELLDIPDNCCMKIPLNEAEEEKILKALHTLYQEPEQRNILGTQARNFVVEQHSMQQAADKYLTFCEKILEQQSKRGI